jgi:hypothetical protein
MDAHWNSVQHTQTQCLKTFVRYTHLAQLNLCFTAMSFSAYAFGGLATRKSKAFSSYDPAWSSTQGCHNKVTTGKELGG